MSNKYFLHDKRASSNLEDFDSRI